MDAVHSLTAEPSQAASQRWKDRGQVSQDGRELRTTRFRPQAALGPGSVLSLTPLGNPESTGIGQESTHARVVKTANQKCFWNN